MSMIFLPDFIYDNFKSQVLTTYATEVNCSMPNMPCMFEQPCDKVSKKELDIQITLKDDAMNKSFKLDID